jgi:hypothetical protein
METMKVNIENIAVCTDCILAIVNDDYIGLDYHYDAQEAAQRRNEIAAGILRLSSLGSIITTGEEDEFSTHHCDCCLSKLAGSRHYCSTLIED